jgi:hypothetical protein
MLPEMTQEERNKVERERQLQRYRTMRDAFLQTFGPPGQRTPLGGPIIAELERFTQWGKPVCVMDSTGQTDIYRTGINEGRREVMQAIHNLIEWKESDHVNTSG